MKLNLQRHVAVGYIPRYLHVWSPVPRGRFGSGLDEDRLRRLPTLGYRCIFVNIVGKSVEGRETELHNAHGVKEPSE